MAFLSSHCFALISLLFLNGVVCHSAKPLVQGRAGAGTCRSTYRIPDLLSATIDEVREGLDCGAFTSVQLTSAYLARIAEANPTLNAVLETNPDALAIAAALDAARGDEARGPLYGIPILIKDNIATFDKLNTTTGSFSLLGAKVTEDSTVIAKLRKAGAIILGKTNMSQWAYARSGNSTHGWTSRGGQTYGAYLPLQDPSGSSSGSGVAPSLGLSMAALGTETGGSIVNPSSINSLVGIKPTVGLTSRYLTIPISSTQDTPMARTVKDAAYLLSIIAGQDAHDNYTSAIPWPQIPNFENYCLDSDKALAGLRIGIPRNSFYQLQNVEAHLAAFEASLPVFENLGAEIVDNANYPDMSYYRFTNSALVQFVEMKKGVEAYYNGLTENPQNITSFQQVIDFTTSFPQEDYPDRDVGKFLTVMLFNETTTDTPLYQQLRERDLIAGSTATILGALDNFNLSALIVPTLFAAEVASIAGYPIVTVPLGYYPANTTTVFDRRGTVASVGPNVPFGISVLGRKFSEPLLIQIAYAFEQATLRRDLVKPYLLPKSQIADFS